MTKSINHLHKMILVAEPNEHHRAQIESIFSEYGFDRVYSVADGIRLKAVLKKFQKKFESIGLIILSYDLPNCNIADLCSALADEHTELKVPVIVLTNHIDADDPNLKKLADLRPQGVTLVEKPIRAQDFMPLVYLALVLKSERDAAHQLQERALTELAEHKILEARLKYLVLHDELTGVGNRRSLEQALHLAIHHCHTYKQCGALLYLDIDRFNVINDIEGHDVGDRLLAELVGLIRSILRGKVNIARIGADEFCIFLSNASKDEAHHTAELIRKEVEDSFKFATPNDFYHVTVSIGIALLTPSLNIHHPSELIAKAHQACYIAKKHGRNLVNLYNSKDIAATHFNDVQWVPLLRDALKFDRFFLTFQPVIRIADGVISHYEVLLRMRDESGKVYTPDIFIPVAERMGLIHNIDMWVIEHAVDFLASLSPKQEHVTLTINLSGFAFQNHQLFPFLQEKIKSAWISPKRLIFEITETATIANFEQTRRMIAKLRSFGCGFALDDFGSGFSSFEYLKNFPVDFIKIDGQFILNLLNDETDQVLVKAMVEIAHKLGKQVIAEFIETPQVLSIVKTLGVDYAQGFLLGQPEEKLLDQTILSLVKYLPENSTNLQIFNP
ncbi:MAG TPA: EAL domain-containing protein [Methylothermaceae bacterium]|nr:EAL domain-containing protein [Methylothermaceae bacterium]